MRVGHTRSRVDGSIPGEGGRADLRQKASRSLLYNIFSLVIIFLFLGQRRLFLIREVHYGTFFNILIRKKYFADTAKSWRNKLFEVGHLQELPFRVHLFREDDRLKRLFQPLLLDARLRLYIVAKYFAHHSQCLIDTRHPTGSTSQGPAAKVCFPVFFERAQNMKSEMNFSGKFFKEKNMEFIVKRQMF